MPAYVDESARLSGAVTCYVMAAVLVGAERAEELRGVLRARLRRGQRRMHWHAEHAGARTALAALVHRLDAPAVVVATRGVSDRTTERARRRCLVRLLWELDQRGAGDVVFESRQHRDADDRRVISAVVHAGHVTSDLGYAFAVPTDEPLLWIADVVAGAAGLAIGDGDARYLDALGDRVAVVNLP
jgi:hypothetical protein